VLGVVLGACACFVLGGILGWSMPIRPTRSRRAFRLGDNRIFFGFYLRAGPPVSIHCGAALRIAWSRLSELATGPVQRLRSLLGSNFAVTPSTHARCAAGVLATMSFRAGV